jgi:hypothetical protein
MVGINLSQLSNDMRKAITCLSPTFQFPHPTIDFVQESQISSFLPWFIQKKFTAVSTCESVSKGKANLTMKNFLRKIGSNSND